jgi:chromosome segregation ATPase
MENAGLKAEKQNSIELKRILEDLEAENAYMKANVNKNAKAQARLVSRHAVEQETAETHARNQRKSLMNFEATVQVLRSDNKVLQDRVSDFEQRGWNRQNAFVTREEMEKSIEKADQEKFNLEVEIGDLEMEKESLRLTVKRGEDAKDALVVEVAKLRKKAKDCEEKLLHFKKRMTEWSAEL